MKDDNRSYIINPLEIKEIHYWSRKWGITAQQLNNAILETGSSNTRNLKAYLNGKKISFFSPTRWTMLLKSLIPSS